jgi:hypothetical protein
MEVLRRFVLGLAIAGVVYAVAAPIALALGM